MTIQAIGAMNNKFIGLSTDVKPTGVQIGAELWAYDIDQKYKCYDGDNWAAETVNNAVKSTTINLQQAAATYDLFTGTAQSVIIDSLLFRLPNVDVSNDVTITSISIQTNDTTSQVIISATNGAKANLTANAQINWIGALLLIATKKIQLTIAGGAADASTVCDVIVSYRPVVAGGYLV